MLKNYFIVAVRNFLRHRFYSWLNVAGLTTGMACCMLILLWVNDEVSVNKFHKDVDKIVKVYSNYSTENGIVTWGNTPGPMADYVREHVVGVQYAARTFSARSLLLQYDDKSFLQNGLYADPELLKIFSFDLKAGTLPANREDKTALLISETLSHTLFADENPLGKQIKLSNQNSAMVVGVFKDCPASSSIKFDFILPLQIFKENRGRGFNWGNFDCALYIKFDDASQIQPALEVLNTNWIEVMKEDTDPAEINAYLQPFAETYLYNVFENGVPMGGRIDYVRIFVIVAIFIVVMASLNFMNMATARALKRSKEIGIRKVVGAARVALIFQFVGEAILTSALAACFAVALVYLILPGFNVLIEKQIQLSFLSPFFLTSLLGLILITGLLSGSYPAFFLSSFDPNAVLKGTASSSLQGAGLRRALVVFQFSLTVVLIICAIVTSQQINYILHKSLGYDRNSVLSFKSTEGIVSHFEAFRLEAGQQKGIVDIARSSASLVNVTNHSNSVIWPGRAGESNLLFRVVVTDHNLSQTMKLKITQGRAFIDEKSDVNNFIISKTTAEIMGFKDPIGKNISVWDQEGKIVGVIDDFHSGTLKQKIEPVILYYKPEFTNEVYVRFEGDQTEQVLKSLEQVLKKYSPEYPFDYKFMDDDFENSYKSEKVTGSLAIGCAAMAIILSGLGLLGLAAYTAERKQKEIGIRKVLGATVSTLVQKISSEFIRLSVIAILIGSFTAYFIMSEFLNGYAYHTTMGWGIFLATAVVTLFLTLAIVIYQVMKSALINPVDVLRSE